MTGSDNADTSNVFRIDESAAGLRRSLEESYRRLDRMVDERDAALADLAAAEARGFDKAVAALRDGDSWRAWRRTLPRDRDGWLPAGSLTQGDRNSAADYLAAVKAEVLGGETT